MAVPGGQRRLGDASESQRSVQLQAGGPRRWASRGSEGRGAGKGGEAAPLLIQVLAPAPEVDTGSRKRGHFLVRSES